MRVHFGTYTPLSGIGCLIVGLLTLVTTPANAHTPHACPTDLPDAPVLSGHIEHADILAGKLSFDAVAAHGAALFSARFNACDGQGRPETTSTGEKRAAGSVPGFNRASGPDASSCAGCHSQPFAGGAGEFVANVFVNARGTVSAAEMAEAAHINERNTLGMHGAGLIEMLAREMTDELEAIREDAKRRAEAGENGGMVTLRLVAKGVDFGTFTARGGRLVEIDGIRGVDPDLIVKPFAQSGTVPSLRVFTVPALNQHHGMQAEELFDLNKRKGADYDGDGVARELTIGDVTALVAFQATLGVPGRVLPADPAARAEVARGEGLFLQPLAMGGADCASCHRPAMKLDNATFSEPYYENPIEGSFRDLSQSWTFDLLSQGPGPFAEATGDGGAIVRAYTDLKRHNMCDDEIDHFCNETFTQGRLPEDGAPGTNFFITRKLWDAGSSAPYGHRGDLSTLAEAILAHGGEARPSRDAFAAMKREDQAAIVKFLKTLQVRPPGSPRVVIEGSEGVAAAPDAGLVIRQTTEEPARKQ